MKAKDLLFFVSIFSVVIVIAFILFPIIRIITGSRISLLMDTVKDKRSDGRYKANGLPLMKLFDKSENVTVTFA